MSADIAAADADVVPQARKRRSPLPGIGRVRLVHAVLAVVLVAVAACSVVLMTQWRGGAQTEQATADGLAAARDLAPKLLSYDYKTPPPATQAETMTTGGFTQEYQALLRQYVSPGAEKQQFVSKVTVGNSSVVLAQPDRVVAMLFLNQTSTSTALSAPQVDSNSVRVTVTKVDGKWLVAGLDIV